MSNEKKTEKTKLKRGERPEGWKKFCAKFKEYYANEHPDWSEEQCIEEAKKFNRRNSYKTIEYWEYRFPNATHEEHLEMLKNALDSSIKKHPQKIEYWEYRFPNATHEEHLEMLKNYNKENNSQCIEYYIKRFPNATHEEHLEMLKNSINKRIQIRPDNTGENNPNHKSNTSEFERKTRSPKCIEFYERLYPTLSHEEHLEMLNKHINNVNEIMEDKTKQVKCVEYWINKGYSKEESEDIISKSQITFSLETCINKYGVEEGIKRFEMRQQKWIKSLSKNFEKYGDGRANSSEFAYDMIGYICKFLNIKRPSKEKYMTDKNGNHFAYDFCYDKKIIEFNGNYWHMNPKIYKVTDINKTTHKTAGEIWEYDKLKLKCAEDNGYKVLYIWEDEYRLSKDSVLKKCMDFLKS